MGLVHPILVDAELDPRRSQLDADELVVVVVGLAADVLTRRQAHDRQLRMLAGEEHRAERFVVERRALDVANPTQHLNLLTGFAVSLTLPVRAPGYAAGELPSEVG